VFSSDFSRALLFTTLPGAPTDINNGPDHYRLDVGQGTSTLMTQGLDAASQVVGASANLDRIVFRQPGSSPIPGLYASDGKNLELLSIYPGPAETPVPSGEAFPVGGAYQWGLGVGEERDGGSWIERGGPHGVSNDARRVYFYDQYSSNKGVLYLRDLTGPKSRTILISASQRQGDNPNDGYRVSFISAAPNGSTVYFVSDDQLTDDPALGGGIYRFDVPSETLTLMAASADDPFGLHLISAISSNDQTHLYFTSTSSLAPGAEAGQGNAYVWTEGAGVRFIAPVGAQDRFSRVTPDGGFALLLSSTSINGTPNGDYSALYEYDYNADHIACVSCQPDGSLSHGDAQISSQSTGFPGVDYTHGRGLSVDGKVFFSSTDRLVGKDQTAAQDVYVYDNGRIGILTSGNDSADSFIADNSDDGAHVFVYTRAALVGADGDSREFDAYDIHVGGGFLEAPSRPLPCEGEACRVMASPVPEIVQFPSSHLAASGNRKPCAKGKVRRNGRCVRSHKKRHRNAVQHKSHKRNANRNGGTHR
jgi:hypothetical protein